jgi:hypothetical protein
MDDYPYVTLGANGWFRCDGLQSPGFSTLFRDVLHHFGHKGTPAYRGRCEVHVDISAHPSDLGMTAWFTTATYDDLDDTLERAAHRALTKFFECHLSGLAGNAIALFPIQNMGNTA